MKSILLFFVLLSVLSLKADAAVYQQIPGFEDVPFSKMGLIAPVGPRGISKNEG